MGNSELDENSDSYQLRENIRYIPVEDIQDLGYLGNGLHSAIYVYIVGYARSSSTWLNVEI